MSADLDGGTIVHRMEFKAGPTQRRFIETDARAALFASRAGEGKSAAIVQACGYFARKYHKANPTAIIARNTLVNLKRTTLLEFLKWWPSGIFGTFHKGDMVYEWTVPGFGGAVHFMGFDSEKATEKVLSMPVDFAGLDEAAPATDQGGINELVLDMLLQRGRNPGVDKPQIKIAVNNTDEEHWLYPRFVDPGSEGFECYQTGAQPENLDHVRKGYYEDMARDNAHRPDLVRRYVEGKWGFQQKGVAVTPQWSDELHLADNLQPIRGIPLSLSWDFGHNPRCTVSQHTKTNWNVLGCYGEDGVGTYQLIESLKPILLSRFENKFVLKHTGDPNGATKDPGDSRNSPLRAIKEELGGSWVAGPTKPALIIDPLQRVLTKQSGGRGLLQVDRVHAKMIWYALRGGWHKQKNARGVVSPNPTKDLHSHPGDTMGYEAARTYPTAAFSKKRKPVRVRQTSMRTPRSGVSTRFAPGARLR